MILLLKLKRFEKILSIYVKHILPFQNHLFVFCTFDYDSGIIALHIHSMNPFLIVCFIRIKLMTITALI